MTDRPLRVAIETFHSRHPEYPSGATRARDKLREKGLEAIACSPADESLGSFFPDVVLSDVEWHDSQIWTNYARTVRTPLAKFRVLPTSFPEISDPVPNGTWYDIHLPEIIAGIPQLRASREWLVGGSTVTDSAPFLQALSMITESMPVNTLRTYGDASQTLYSLVDAIPLRIKQDEDEAWSIGRLPAIEDFDARILALRKHRDVITDKLRAYETVMPAYARQESVRAHILKAETD